MASRVCPEDVVVLASDPSTPGMVCCVGEDTENLSNASQPTAHVYWLREHDNDKMEPISELRILDRALLHGDTVVHNKRKGLVTATRIQVDMRYADGTIVRGVKTEDLRHLQPFRQGNWVASDGWLGRVLSCRDDVIVQFDDNSQCLVSATANSELQAMQKMYERSPFFPSMAVKASNSDIFADAEWIRGSYARQEQGIVASTRPAEVLVAWIAALQGSSPQPPSTSIAPECLCLLDHFGHTWWRLGDRTIYMRDEDGEDKNDEMRQCCEIIGTNTHVDIKYLDGTCALGIPATETLMFNPGPHEFYPGDLVCDKDAGDTDEKSNTMSVLLSADERTRMAVIRRVGPVPQQEAVPAPHGVCTESADGSENSDLGTAASTDMEARCTDARLAAAPGQQRHDHTLSEEITCSVFDLQAHPDFSFRMGDVVIRLDTGGMPVTGPGARDAGVQADEGEDTADDNQALQAALAESSLANGGDRAEVAGALANAWCGDASCTSKTRSADGAGTVGEVIDVEKSGYVAVAWLGGAVTLVHPEEIYRVAIEEEMEDAMFYPDENGFGANGQPPSSFLPVGASGAESDLATSMARVASMPLLHASLSKLILPMVRALSFVGSSMLSLPVLGKVIESSGSVMSVVLTQFFRLFAPLRPLPSNVRSGGAGPAGAGMGLALSPSMLATSLGLGRLLGLSQAPAPVHTESTASNSSAASTQAPPEEADELTEDGAEASKASATRSEQLAANACEAPLPATSAPCIAHDSWSAPTPRSALSQRSVEGNSSSSSRATDAALVGNSVSADAPKVPARDPHAECSGESGALPAGARGDNEETPAGGEKADGRRDDGLEVSAGAEAHAPGDDAGTASSEEFEKVQIVEEERAWENHHYASRTETPRSARKFMSRVQKEWNLLRESLPPDIYVVVFEDRCDLLQAVIKGPQDSPYADGLFFFDIQLPSEYPDLPPRVYYHSHGDRLNPNLYENGKVCLSLLGTWAGSSVESWDPAKSNILQVVVSIQGLILVPEPYYNEPSYEQYRGSEEGKRASSQYNESAMLLTLQSILASARQPPLHFQKLAESHYRQTRERLLARCRVKLAEAQAQAQETEDGAASLGFALSLDRMVPRLETALWKL